MDNIEYMYKIRLSYLYNNELIELGHEIPGVILSPKFSVTILTKSGEVAKKYRVYNVDETKPESLFQVDFYNSFLVRKNKNIYL